MWDPSWTDWAVKYWEESNIIAEQKEKKYNRELIKYKKDLERAWKKYIIWENEQKELHNKTKLYERSLIKLPGVHYVTRAKIGEKIIYVNEYYDDKLEQPISEYVLFYIKNTYKDSNYIEIMNRERMIHNSYACFWTLTTEKGLIIFERIYTLLEHIELHRIEQLITVCYFSRENFQTKIYILQKKTSEMLNVLNNFNNIHNFMSFAKSLDISDFYEVYNIEKSFSELFMKLYTKENINLINNHIVLSEPI